MRCQRCKSTRVMEFCAKSSDANWGIADGIGFEGYVPDGLGVGSGDYVEFSLCINCGQMQGTFPLEKFKGE